jgi:hypothetical protein
MKTYKDGKDWIAEDGTYRAKASTKRDAMASIERQHAKAALDIPEIRAIQQRWVMAIEAIVPGLDPTDAYARMWLVGLQSSIESFESMARGQALHIEQRIQELRERTATTKQVAAR